MLSTNRNRELLFAWYFPVCPVVSSCKPFVLHHLGSSFLAPEKCLSCRLFNEGSCLRSVSDCSDAGSDSVRYPSMALDFGPCGVPDVSAVAKAVIRRYGTEREVWVPAKCVECKFFTHTGECSRYFSEFGLPCSLDFGGIADPVAGLMPADEASEWGTGDGD